MLTPIRSGGMKIVKSQSIKVLAGSFGDLAIKPYIELAMALQATIVWDNAVAGVSPKPNNT